MGKQKAVIFANGELSDLAAARALIEPGDFLVAADGGARRMAALGLTPALVVGDLDSLTADEVLALREAGIEILQFPAEKDETDLELALLEAVRRGYGQIFIAAALGGRLDQTLANVFLLALPELAGVDARLHDGREEAFLIRGVGEVTGQAGEFVSLLPLFGPAEGIHTTGLRYPLRGETLLPERSRGISNEMLGELAEVSLEKGVLLCIHRLGGEA
ncbi:MAG: thiamine diphosphokinase [Anaerolineaceae bacterium]|nr:thiamine diphosphokinase [Anaerolineaceae bacterium]